jgi:hypothetical protein
MVRDALPGTSCDARWILHTYIMAQQEVLARDMGTVPVVVW